MTNPKIDPEFAKYLRPLSEAELGDLHASLESDGCRDRLVVWQEENILIDGHHRRVYCDANCIQYDYAYISLPNREAAKMWIIRNQFGRRNATVLEQRNYIGQVYRASVGEPGGAPKDNVAEQIAKSVGVSPRTVLNDAEFHDAMEVISGIDGKARDAILSGTAGVKARDVKDIIELPPEVMKAVVTKLADGVKFNEIKDADPVNIPKRHVGAPVFDDRKISRRIADLVRDIEERSKKHGKGPEYARCDKAMNDLENGWKAWLAATT